MSTRFDAEAILRAAASGAIPAPGDVLIRVQDGWVFGQPVAVVAPESVGPEEITSLPFTKITGSIADGQVPVSAVTQHQAALLISFTQLTDQIADDQVPASAVLQHLEEIQQTLDFLLACVTSNKPKTPIEKLHSAEAFV